MAVPKIAVIALVAIIAVPILLGYAMNLDEVSVTDYKASGESVNVTQLLQNGSGYSYTDANIYTLNTNFNQGYWVSPARASGVMPVYTSSSTTSSSFPADDYQQYSAGQYPNESRYNFSDYDYFYFQSDWDGVTGGYLIVQVFDENNNIVASQGDLHSFKWDRISSSVEVTYYGYGTQALRALQWDSLSNTYQFRFYPSSYNSTGYMINASSSTHSKYIDLAAGFTIDLPVDVADDSAINDSLLNNNEVVLNLPEYPNNILLTMDLSTITDSSHTLIIDLEGYGIFDEIYTLVKTTDSSGEHWKFYAGRPYTGLTELMDLYYDSSRSSNTYQILIDNSGIEFRYVGNWPTIIGAANYYQQYRYDRDFNYYIGGVKQICFWNDTPKMRVDASEYRAFEYPIIENQTYTPSEFRSNPATTITNTTIYGYSLTFGSNTYTVTNGNITIGTHTVPVKGMVLDSVPNGQGNYDNRINGTKVSETADPAAITFDGQWSASISTTAQESYTYTKTEWNAGEFAWDGIDQNFLIVGLITCLGAFVALGIYARKSRSGGIIPLMIVTGCAAMVFFIMI